MLAAIQNLMKCSCTYIKNSYSQDEKQDEKQDEEEENEDEEYLIPHVNFRATWNEERGTSKSPVKMEVEINEIDIEELPYYKNILSRNETPKCGAPTKKNGKGRPCKNSLGCTIKSHVKWRTNNPSAPPASEICPNYEMPMMNGKTP